jgi:hypothetical protein
MMPFELKNVLVTFSRVVVDAFKDFIHKCLEVYRDDCTIFILLKYHVDFLRLMLDRCRQCKFCFNIEK